MKSEQERKNEKSKNRDRSIPTLEELHPSSVIKIFQYIKELIENKDLDLDFFNSRNNIFNREELYFVDYYIKSYLKSTNTHCYFRNWLQNQEEYLDSPELFKSFSDYRSSIDLRVSKILSNIKALESKRISENKSIKKVYDVQNVLSIPITYRVPLVIPFDNNEVESFTPSKKIIEFKNFVIENLKSVLREEDILLFFNNSFSIKSNYLPPDLLDLRVIDKYIFGESIQKIWLYYNSKMYNEDWLKRMQIKDFDRQVKEIDKQIKNFDKEIKDFETFRKDLEKENNTCEKIDSFTENNVFFSNYNISIKKATKANKLGFMKVLYNSFPYIRDGYYKKLMKNKKLTIDEYLKSRISSVIRE